MTKKHASVKTEKQEREARMRALIKKEAFALMAEKGLDGVSMREIAEKVKVTKPVLYYYFKDKEDLCRSIMADHEARFEKRVEKAYASNQSPQQAVLDVMSSHLTFFTENPVNSKFLLQMFAYTLNHKIDMPENKSCFYRKMTEYLHKAEQEGKIPAGSAGDIVKLMGALSADMMLGSYIHQHVLHNGNMVPAGTLDFTMLERLIQIILLGVKAYHKTKSK